MSTTSNNSGNPDPNALVAASKNNGQGQSEGFTHTCKDGRIVHVREGFGEDAIKATRMCGGDQSMWMPALLAILGTCDGQQMVMEDWLKLPLKDYMTIAAELGGNFI